VEEYKRPKFYVDYEKQKGGYRVGDSIRVTGLAKGYAGNGIDGASVVYRVTRKARFPTPGPPAATPSSVNAAEIGHGQMQTDAGGKFSISFYALPDGQVSKDTKPEYTYEISADVTDPGGETRSGKTDLVAGYTVLRLSIDLAHGDHLPADSLRQIMVNATNLSGEPVAGEIHLAIYPLQAPQRLIRQRLWKHPIASCYRRPSFWILFPTTNTGKRRSRIVGRRGQPFGLWPQTVRRRRQFLPDYWRRVGIASKREVLTNTGRRWSTGITWNCTMRKRAGRQPAIQLGDGRRDDGGAGSEGNRLHRVFGERCLCHPVGTTGGWKSIPTLPSQ